MIKIGTRPNLFYPSMFIIFNGLRKIDSIIMEKYFNFSCDTLFIFLMFFADFLSGLTIYLSQQKFLRKKDSGAYKFMGIELIKNELDMNRPDGTCKILLLFFLGSYLDFVEYIFSSYYLPGEYGQISISLEWRLKSFIICTSALFCYFILGLPIFKHQKISLIIILICLIILVVTEMIEYYQDRIFKVIFFLVINQAFNSGLDVIEKYLLEYDFLNPFIMLMTEGLIGLFYSSLFAIYQNPFQKIKSVYKMDPGKMPFLIIFLIIFFILTCVRNIYRVITNKLYSPTNKALFDYILTPLIIVYYFISKDNNDNDLYSFIINLFISLITVFCSLIYNDFIIIFCCDMEHNTHYEVSKRASVMDLEALNDSDCDSTFNEQFF